MIMFLKIIQNQRIRRKEITCDSVALDKRISKISRTADTDWEMIVNIALSIQSTQSRTRIHTLVIQTSLVAQTFCVHHTFWPTIWRGANHARLTSAVTSFTDNSWRVWVWTTWIRFTWVNNYSFSYRDQCWINLNVQSSSKKVKSELSFLVK